MDRDRAQRSRPPQAASFDSRARSLRSQIPICGQCREEDSNLRRLSQRVYSPPPLATRESLRAGNCSRDLSGSNLRGPAHVSPVMTGRLLTLAGAALVVVATAAGSSVDIGTWTKAPRMLRPRAAHAVVGARGSIVALGGTGAQGAPVLTVERFDGRSWRVETRLPVPGGLNATAAAAVGGRVYVIGGFTST